jgi:hypothetical protein
VCGTDSNVIFVMVAVQFVTAVLMRVRLRVYGTDITVNSSLGGVEIGTAMLLKVILSVWN